MCQAADKYNSPTVCCPVSWNKPGCTLCEDVRALQRLQTSSHAAGREEYCEQASHDCSTGSTAPQAVHTLSGTVQAVQQQSEVLGQHYNHFTLLDHYLVRPTQAQVDCGST